MSMGSQPTPPSVQSNIGGAIGTSYSQLPLNEAAQAGSQYNQTTPTGSLSYQQIGTGPGGVPIYSANTSYSPIEQSLFNQYTGTQQQAGGEAGNVLGYGNYGNLSPTQAIGSETTGTTSNLMSQWLSAQEPFYKTQTDQLDTQLRNQGLAPGQPAYDNAMRSLTTNQGYAVAGAASQFEPTAFSQATQLYNLPLQTASTLMQLGAPASATGQFTNNLPALQAPQISNVLGGINTAAQNQFQAQQGQATANNNAIGGLFGMGGNALASLLPSGSSAAAPIVYASDAAII